MSINLPPGGQLTDPKSGSWTTSMWAWMRDVTASVTGGVVSSVTATAPIVSSGGTTPNISLANTAVTPATYGDSTHVSQFTVDQKGRLTFAQNVAFTSSVLLHTTVTLTNAQIKTMPSGPVTLVAAQGVGTRIQPVLIDLDASFAAGAYTNIDPSAFLVARVGSGEIVTSSITNDSTIPLTYLTDAFDANHRATVLVPFTHSEPVGDWGNLAYSPVISGASLNSVLEVVFDNNGAGNLTGGNAANTLTINSYYVVLS